MIPSHEYCHTTGRICGYDEIAPFPHEFNKIVAKECAKHSKLDVLPWYSTWEQWNDKYLLRSPSINNIGKIIFPELKYAEQTIQKIVQRIKSDILPVLQYMQENHVFDTSVVWESLIEVDSFRSLKSKKKRKNKDGRDSTAKSYSENSSS